MGETSLSDEFAALRGTAEQETTSGPRKKRGRRQDRSGHTADSAKIDAALGNAQKAVAMISEVPALVEEKVNEVFGEANANLPGWWKGQLSQARKQISEMNRSRASLEARVDMLTDKVTWLEEALRHRTQRSSKAPATESPEEADSLGGQISQLRSLIGL